MRIKLDWIKLDTIKSGLHIAYGVVLVGLFLFLSPEIKAAAQMLVVRFETATALEVPGVKLTFSETEIGRGFDLLNIELKGYDNRAVVRKKIEALDSKQLIRLMTVGPTSRSCEHENPNPEMRRAVALDHELADMDLATIKWDEDALGQVREADLSGREMARRDGKPGDIGKALRCYEMTLTAIGSNVKTGIVTTIAPAFNGLGRAIAPADAPADGSKVTAMN